GDLAIDRHEPPEGAQTERPDPGQHQDHQRRREEDLRGQAHGRLLLPWSGCHRSAVRIKYDVRGGNRTDAVRLRRAHGASWHTSCARPRLQRPDAWTTMCAAMEFGFSLPGRGPLAGAETILKLATKAESLRFSSLFVTDHVVLPASMARSTYPYSTTGQLPG